MGDEPNIDQLYEMALAAKPYLRTSLERMYASITTIESLSARRGFADYLRKIIVADHSEALKLMQEKWPDASKS